MPGERIDTSIDELWVKKSQADIIIQNTEELIIKAEGFTFDTASSLGLQLATARYAMLSAYVQIETIRRRHKPYLVNLFLVFSREELENVTKAAASGDYIPLSCWLEEKARQEDFKADAEHKFGEEKKEFAHRLISERYKSMATVLL